MFREPFGVSFHLLFVDRRSVAIPTIPAEWRRSGQQGGGRSRMGSFGRRGCMDDFGRRNAFYLAGHMYTKAFHYSQEKHARDASNSDLCRLFHWSSTTW